MKQNNEKKKKPEFILPSAMTSSPDIFNTHEALTFEKLETNSNYLEKATCFRNKILCMPIHYSQYYEFMLSLW